MDRSNATLRRCLKNYVAVRMKDCIIIVSSYEDLAWEDQRPRIRYEPEHMVHFQGIWVYNLWTEQWSKIKIITTQEKKIPITEHQTGVVVGSDVYMFGGYDWRQMLWRLTRISEDIFECTIIGPDSQLNMPSTRTSHCGWEHTDKMWIFGGDTSPKTIWSKSYTNQLLCYDPARSMWENVKSLDSVPSPRPTASAAKIGDKVWICTSDLNLLNDYDYDFCELNMISLTWTQIETNLPPSKYSIFTLRPVPITTNQILFHRYDSVDSMWIFDVESHTWRQKSTTDAYHERCVFMNTATTGLNSEVVILGPIKMNKSTHISVRLEPSLQQLAMGTIWKHRRFLPWKSLPSKLISKLLGTEIY